MPRIQHKRGTAANLASVNPTPLAGELVWDSTENAIKVGDGATAWASLAYVTATPRSHNHDDRYYTETEVDGFLDGKSDTGHNHGLSSLSDVSAAAPISDKAFLVYNSSLSQWVASTGIGQVGVGAQPLGGWPAGSVGASLAGKASTTHASTHATGGSDALTPGDIGAAPAASPTFTGTVTVPGLTSTGVILADDSVAANSVVYSFDGDPNSGIGRAGADIVTVVTNGSERVRVRADGGVAIGSAGFANHRFAIIAGLTSAGGNIVNYSACTAQTGVTSVYGNWTQVSVASGVTLSVLHHNYVTQGTFTGAVTTQSGFFVESTLTGATNNYGFRGAIASGTGRWNLYMDGTAQNWLNGNTGIGVAVPTAALDINADKIRLRTAKTPASASDTGNAGDICWDASYLYICTATNTWRRIAHSTW